jgi:hypothetical protein
MKEKMRFFTFDNARFQEFFFILYAWVTVSEMRLYVTLIWGLNVNCGKLYWSVELTMVEEREVRS